MPEPARRAVGVLGGMGPAATLDFFARLLAHTPASTDQEHLRIIIDNNPALPNRHEAISRGDPRPGQWLAEMARGLAGAGADFLVMPCNTAHVYEPVIRAATPLPFLSCIAETCAEVERRLQGTGRVGLLAADGCLRVGLYQKALACRGLSAVVQKTPALERFMDLVYRIKAGDRGAEISQAMRALVGDLMACGADLVVAGCTEASLVLDEADAPCPLIDSTDVLARRTVAFALGCTP